MVRFTLKDLEATSETFDPYKEEWDKLEIVKTNDSKSCFIRRHSSNTIIKEIKLSNNSRVNIFCSWGFYESSKTGKFIPRPTFYKLNNDNSNTETSKNKVIVGIDDGDLPVKFWEMINFLSGYKDLIELGEFENKYRVISTDQLLNTLSSYGTDKQLKTIKKCLQKNDNITYKQIETLLDTSKIKSLQEFKKLLDDDSTSENEWQKFFDANQWIFAGISLKLFFQKDIIPQADIGTSDTRGKGSPISDILCIDKYITLVELKKHTTPIFTNIRRNTARANTWSFSPEFIDGISQCLAQKQVLIENYKIKNFVNKNGKRVKAEAIDPKVIFIIGRYDIEISDDENNIDDKVKADTFERYRRDCRNVEIITYDELYERAKCIVNSISTPL